MNTPQDYRKLYDLTGKVALVTGGGGGIGSAVCEGLAAFGAGVVVAGRTGAKLEKVADSINDSGGKAEAVEMDITRVEDTRKKVANIAEKWGKIDVLVNCVGFHIEAPAEKYKEEDWDRIFEINIKAAFFISQSVANTQISKGGGKHIHVTSVRSLLGLHRGYASYCASKGGMNIMIKQLATEWAKHNITVNGIAPTFTRTDLVKEYLEDPDFYNPLVARIPLGRVCEPIDLAGLALYLSAPASDFITGQIIFADGGVTACQ